MKSVVSEKRNFGGALWGCSSNVISTGGRTVLVVLCIWVLALAHALADQGQDNPMGVTGVYNGNVTTGGSYDPFSGNAARVIDDIVVPGAVGSYPLKWTRHFNSSTTYDFGSTGGNWRYSYVDYSYRDGSCAGGVRAWGNIVTPPSTCTMLWFPDGRFLDLNVELYGVPEHVEPYPDPATNTTSPALFLADGGKVLFQTSDNTYYKPFKILDPYGHATRITYEVLNGIKTTTITEPGGRYLLVTYGDIDAATYSENK